MKATCRWEEINGEETEYTWQRSTLPPAPLVTEHKKVPMLQLLNDKITEQSKAGAKTSPTICTETAKYTIENVTNTPFRQMHLFLCMTDFELEKIWPPVLCCMAVPLVVISTLSDLLLNAGCFWPVVLPLWDIAFHLGTNWRLLIERRTRVGFLQSWRIVLSSTQQLLHPFFQEANVNLIAIFLGNEKKGLNQYTTNSAETFERLSRWRNTFNFQVMLKVRSLIWIWTMVTNVNCTVQKGFRSGCAQGNAAQFKTLSTAAYKFQSEWWLSAS